MPPATKPKAPVRRGRVEALAKELYETGMTSCDQGYIAWDDLPAPMRFAFMAIAVHVIDKYIDR